MYFVKDYIPEQCLVSVAEEWQRALGIVGYARILLTRLSKTFNPIDLELILARLNDYGLDSRSVQFLSFYLSKRKEITKVNSSYSNSDWILFGVSPGSILGPLLFNIYIYHLFYQIERLDLAI